MTERNVTLYKEQRHLLNYNISLWGCFVYYFSEIQCSTSFGNIKLISEGRWMFNAGQCTIKTNGLYLKVLTFKGRWLPNRDGHHH